MSLLTNDWGFAVNKADFNPNDPLVNTASEYMYQMATISHHTLSGTQTVVLPKDVTAADGTVFKAGTYDFPVDGRYFSQFNRANPIEAAAREQAWTGTALALVANLGVGSRHRDDDPDGLRTGRALRGPRRDDHPDGRRPRVGRPGPGHREGPGLPDGADPRLTSLAGLRPAST